MANPLKRVCLNAARQISTSPEPQQRHALRCLSSTTSHRATPKSTTTSVNSKRDAYLDSLASRPGVKYTIEESVDDLRSLNLEDMSSLAHRELEQHRELREMVRLAAWEMPLLSQLWRRFHKPERSQVLTWRYTTYMGEPHPAARKVVVTFDPRRLGIETKYRGKFLKLVGPRYNPRTNTVKMSCESFETQAQNKRYLADTINKLIAEAQDPEADSFSDVPLDLRHHKKKVKPIFPRGWAMTPQRRQLLEKKRQVAVLEEGRRVEENRLVDGLGAIGEAMKVDQKKIEEPVMAQARQRLPIGKMGKKQMGQQPVQR